MKPYKREVEDCYTLLVWQGGIESHKALTTLVREGVRSLSANRWDFCAMSKPPTHIPLRFNRVSILASDGCLLV